MSPFDTLLIGHFIGDFLLQTNWMAGNKAHNPFALFVHSLVYTLTIAVVAGVLAAQLSFWSILLLFFSHFFLDRRTLVAAWVTYVMRPVESEKKWLSIVADQVFHLLILVLVLYL